MPYVYLGLGALVAGLVGLARGSMRRLEVAGALGLLAIFVAFPVSAAVGFLSRETLLPTQLALAPVFPALYLVPVAALLALAGAHFGRRASAIGATIGAVLALTTGLLWQQQAPILTELRAVPGLMEAVAGAVVLAIFVLLARGSRPRLRLPLLVAGVALGVLAGAWLASPFGHIYFPNVQGYYKLLERSSSQQEAGIIKSYNQGLAALNEQRRSLGLAEVAPITTLGGLEGQKLPREAAEAGFRLVRPGRTPYGSGIFFLFSGLLLGAGLMQLWRPQLEHGSDLATGGLLAAIVAALAPAFAATDFSLGRLVEGWPFLMNFLDRSWPPLLALPELGRFPLQQVASEMLLTVEIALIGTFLAALIALPLSFLASRNLSGGNALSRVVFALTRGFFNVDRGIDALILALIFVAAVGLGPFAGVLAMAIHSIADLGKVYSESIENVDPGPIEALDSVGAAGSNVVRWAILPQVLPLFVSWTLYRFEINFRVSIVLGLVGAGGIGFFIQEKMASGAYDEMVIAIIAIVIVVNIIDFASSWLRGRLV